MKDNEKNNKNYQESIDNLIEDTDIWNKDLSYGIFKGIFKNREYVQVNANMLENIKLKLKGTSTQDWNRMLHIITRTHDRYSLNFEVISLIGGVFVLQFYTLIIDLFKIPQELKIIAFGLIIVFLIVFIFAFFKYLTNYVLALSAIEIAIKELKEEEKHDNPELEAPE